MKIDYLKYLTIPIMVCITYVVFMQVYAYLNSAWLGYDYFEHFSISRLVYSLLFSFLTLFVGTLIFSIAYKQTGFTLTNIIYVLTLAAVLVLKNFIIWRLTTFLIKLADESLDADSIVISFFQLFFNPISSLLVIAAIGYLYAYINKLTASPASNKLICLLLTGLFISLSISQAIINNVKYSGSGIDNLLWMFIINAIGLIILFIYCYTWFCDLLAVKDTTNYPVKTILSFSLSLLIMLIIYICFAIIFIFIFASSSRQGIQTLFVFGTLFSYVIGILLFIKLLNLSSSTIYRTTHYLLYFIALISVSILIISVGLADIYIFIVFYGVTLFSISLSLHIVYIANKLAIKLVFKNNNDQLKNQLF